MSKSHKAAFQNQSRSEVDRACSSASEFKPCLPMNRRKLLCAINSAEGRQTTSPPKSKFFSILAEANVAQVFNIFNLLYRRFGIGWMAKNHYTTGAPRAGGMQFPRYSAARQSRNRPQRRDGR